MEKVLAELKEKWGTILDYLHDNFGITDISFNTWLSTLEVVSIEDNNKIILMVGTDSNKIPPMGINHIINRYGVFIKNSIEEIMCREFEIDIVGKDDILKETKKETHKAAASNQADGLNPKYTFENYVVSSNNQLSYAASLAVAESPYDNHYNPLYIYGNAGLGKTHLMQSIAHYIIENNPDMKVMYVTSEVFTNELIDAIRHGASTPPEFRAKYRNVDVLLVDDIQFLIGKERTQEEFFYTFNALYDAKKQIVISSDKPPKDLITLEDRLKTRFEWGLIVDISIPDFETKMAILRKKTEMLNISISDDILEYIALNITSNVRELEGSLTKINAMSKLQKRDINMSLAQEAIRDIIAPLEKKKLTCEFIIDIVSEHFGISSQEIYSKGRNKNIAYPRQIAMYLCKRFTEENFSKIGELLGRDHSTVLHGYNKIEDDIDKNPTVKNTVDILIKKINPES